MPMVSVTHHVLHSPCPALQVREGLRHFALEALAEQTAKGQAALELRESSKVRRNSSSSGWIDERWMDARRVKKPDAGTGLVAVMLE
jgi:hypothetical protein